jgi:hypothetical protein
VAQQRPLLAILRQWVVHVYCSVFWSSSASQQRAGFTFWLRRQLLNGKAKRVTEAFIINAFRI